MSSHAEDEAWATAAAAEAASRGKPAYQRTCPFYKIIPGFFICVDAFRYGAVTGCNAYFLSHFHSDHYIGLTASWCHGPIYCSRVTGNLVRQQLRVDPKWVVDVEFEEKIEVPGTNGVEVTMIDANHCPGSSLFLFEKVVGRGNNPKVQRVLHCGDFRACAAHIQHPLLRPDIIDPATGNCTGRQQIDVCYLDTTYLNPRYSFPSQDAVINACAAMCANLANDLFSGGDAWEEMLVGRAGRAMTKFIGKKESSSKTPDNGGTESANPTTTTNDNSTTKARAANSSRLLIVVGTYSIGKERICIGIARALNTKIFAPPNKQKICACLEDPALNALLTTNPLKAQVHMNPLAEISPSTLSDYLKPYSPHFTHVLGIRPSGWTYKPLSSIPRPPNPTVQDILHSPAWKSHFGPSDLVPQRGATREVASFAVPYSEHSSFRELTMFCCGLGIGRVVPTVGVGSAKVRERMKGWVGRWEKERKRVGFFRVDGEGGGVW
jgi:DNA cross-link repair 1A protein